MGRLSSVPVCPVCGEALDGFIGTSPVPKAGDLSVCAYCTEVNVYVVADGVTSIRLPTWSEKQEIDASLEVQHHRGVVRRARERLGRVQ